MRRREDRRLITGAGSFLDDVRIPGLLHVSVLRSPYAHALIKSIDLEGLRGVGRVKAVLTGKEAAKVSGPIRPAFVPDGLKIPSQYCLAVGRVRYVGEPVVAVAAEDGYACEDALDSIEVEYEPIPAVTDARAAMESDAIHRGVPRNLYQERRIRAGDARRAFDGAHHVVTERFTIQRQAGVPLEPRGVVASYLPSEGSLTVLASTQIPHGVRTFLSQTLHLPTQKVRVIAKDVGGGFGTYKYHPEDVIASLLSMRTSRPVKWVASRHELFIAGYHSRDQTHAARMALASDGRIIALEDRIIADIGAYLVREATGPANVSANILPGPYRIENVDIELLCVATNKSPAGAYRGFGRPEANFVIERLLDIAAEELGLDPAEIRFRNLLEPEMFPYRSSTGMTYDRCDFPRVLAKLLAEVGYREFRALQGGERRRGVYRGLGLAIVMETTGRTAAPGVRGGNLEGMTVRFDEAGNVSVYTALMPHGQSIETMLASVVAEQLGLDEGNVRVLYGDTDLTPYGQGTFSSRSAFVGSAAAVLAAREIVEKGRGIAAALLRTEPGDVVFERGRFFVNRAPAESVDIGTVAREAMFGNRLPAGPSGVLEATSYYDPPAYSVSYGAHAAVVRVDPESGAVKVEKYVVVEDCGRVINPSVVEGQIQGGVVQGIGGALLEELVYGSDGQLMTAGLMDYPIPSASDVPTLSVDHIETISQTHPLGVRGVGESGIIPVGSVMASAVDDALGPFKIRTVQVPITPERIWRQLKLRRR